MAKYREQRDSDNVLSGYIRTSDGATIPMDTGNKDYREVLRWISEEGGVPDADPDVLALVKQQKIQEVKTEAVRRIGLQVSEWDDIEKIKFMASIWNLLDTASVTTAQSNARDIYLFAANTAIPTITGMTTVPEVQAVDVPNHPGWPF